MKKDKWYRVRKFPLIPILNIREADRHNNRQFTFRWLFIKIWSHDQFAFELSVVLSTYWGLGFVGVVPYLRWVISIPIHEDFAIKIDKVLSRRKRIGK
jgi:hypothetical protein